ncbi:MAG TPA: beta-propeller fold lactonase family protein [Terriglobales bacterium]|jgi:6-phosphogluconolactonase (cycloisomerase 2 family)|nr:beta-propeller fold lactonase family protein [Terriglobales bacterium]
MGMKSRWALVVLGIAPVLVLNSCSSSNNVSSTTSFMWVATQGDQMVRSYTISQNNGAINPVGTNGTPKPTGAQPQAMIITPDGKAMFIANAGGTITAYTINGDGTLSSAGSPVNAGSVPVALIADPASKFLFVANQGSASDVTSGTISVFAISGANLTPVGNPVPTELPGDVSGSGPSGLAVSPVGSFLYVANQFSNNVQGYSYDASGSLALINTYTAGTNPTGLAFSRCAGITSSTSTVNCTVADDNNLFVSNSGSNNISIFSACIQVSATCGGGGTAPDGTLTEIPSKSPVAAGVGPATIFVNPTSDFVYAVDRGSSQVSEYQYSPATGVLTPLATGSGGASAFSGGITSNIANNTNTFNWVVVTNNGSSNLSTFQVVTTGKLIAPSSSLYAVQGQPSAILLR